MNSKESPDSENFIKDRSSFLSLPGEVRNLIYRYVASEDHLTVQDGTVYRVKNNGPNQPGSVYKTQDGTTQRGLKFSNKLTFFLTNHQVYDEGIHYLYKTHRFYFKITAPNIQAGREFRTRLVGRFIPTDCPGLRSVFFGLRCLDSEGRSLSQLRHITLSVTDASLREGEVHYPSTVNNRFVSETLGYINERCENLETLRLNDKSATSIQKILWKRWIRAGAHNNKRPGRMIAWKTIRTFQKLAKRVKRIEIATEQHRECPYLTQWLRKIAPKERWSKELICTTGVPLKEPKRMHPLTVYALACEENAGEEGVDAEC